MRFRIERLGTSMSMSVALSPYITNERADSPQSRAYYLLNAIRTRAVEHDEIIPPSILPLAEESGNAKITRSRMSNPS